jgi:hypothetical protein
MVNGYGKIMFLMEPIGTILSLAVSVAAGIVQEDVESFPVEQSGIWDAAYFAVTESVKIDNGAPSLVGLAHIPAAEPVSLFGRQNQILLRKASVARLQKAGKRAVPFTGSEMRLKNEKRSEDKNCCGGGDKEQNCEKK